MIFKKHYIVPFIRTERLEPLSPLVSSDQEWQVHGGGEEVDDQGAKNNYFDDDDEEADEFTSPYFK